MRGQCVPPVARQTTTECVCVSLVVITAELVLLLRFEFPLLSPSLLVMICKRAKPQYCHLLGRRVCACVCVYACVCVSLHFLRQHEATNT